MRGRDSDITENYDWESIVARLSVVPDMKPEPASCNAGSINFVLAGLVPQLTGDAPAWEKKYLTGTYDNVFANIYQGLDTYIHTIQESGTIPEFEIYDAGMINNIAYFKRQGILKCPIFCNSLWAFRADCPHRWTIWYSCAIPQKSSWTSLTVPARRPEDINSP